MHWWRKKAWISFVMAAAATDSKWKVSIDLLILSMVYLVFLLLIFFSERELCIRFNRRFMPGRFSCKESEGACHFDLCAQCHEVSGQAAVGGHVTPVMLILDLADGGAFYEPEVSIRILANAVSTPLISFITYVLVAHLC
jgi:hypothetical protein